ncbi:hypothetical protein MVEG_04523 [Podila verticillata NRRL 6337]|nr:hypothetical protein MVEG_04523 [Podila verticillata NRRL 6337]
MDAEITLTPHKPSAKAPHPAQTSTTLQDERNTKDSLTNEATDLLDYILRKDPTDVESIDLLVYMMQTPDQDQDQSRAPLRPFPSLILPYEETRDAILEIYNSLRRVYPALTDDQMTAIMAHHEQVYLSVNREFFDSILAAQEGAASSSLPQPTESHSSIHHIEQAQELVPGQELAPVQEVQARLVHEVQVQEETGHQTASGSGEGYIREIQDTRNSSLPASHPIHPNPSSSPQGSCSRQQGSISKTEDSHNSPSPRVQDPIQSYPRQPNVSQTLSSRQQGLGISYSDQHDNLHASSFRYQSITRETQDTRNISSPISHPLHAYPHQHNDSQGLSSRHQGSHVYLQQNNGYQVSSFRNEGPLYSDPPQKNGYQGSSSRHQDFIHQTQHIHNSSTSGGQDPFHSNLQQYSYTDRQSPSRLVYNNENLQASSSPPQFNNDQQPYFAHLQYSYDNAQAMYSSRPHPQGNYGNHSSHLQYSYDNPQASYSSHLHNSYDGHQDPSSHSQYNYNNQWLSSSRPQGNHDHQTSSSSLPQYSHDVPQGPSRPQLNYNSPEDPYSYPQRNADKGKGRLRCLRCPIHCSCDAEDKYPGDYSLPSNLSDIYTPPTDYLSDYLVDENNNYVGPKKNRHTDKCWSEDLPEKENRTNRDPARGRDHCQMMMTTQTWLQQLSPAQNHRTHGARRLQETRPPPPPPPPGSPPPQQLQNHQTHSARRQQPLQPQPPGPRPRSSRRTCGTLWDRRREDKTPPPHRPQSIPTHLYRRRPLVQPIPPRPPKPAENVLPLAYPASPPIKPSDHEHTKREIRRHHHEVLHFRWPAIRPPSPGIVGRYTPYTHASLFGTMMDNALTFSALQRAVGTVQGFNERHYWFDRNRRHSFPEERNMGIVWSPVLVPSEDETMEEDEIMETGQAIGYPPIAREVASAPEEDLWMEGHEGNALVGEVSIAPATEEEGNEVMEVGQADGYVPPEVQVTSGTQAMEDSHVGDAPEEPYYSPGSPPEVVSPEPLEQPKQGQEEEVATSGSEQPTWTEDGDITTDLEMLPRQPVYGMVLRPRRRNPNASIHANGGRSDPGCTRNRLYPRKASH